MGKIIIGINMNKAILLNDVLSSCKKGLVYGVAGEVVQVTGSNAGIYFVKNSDEKRYSVKQKDIQIL
jgi:hypothetical protein